MMQREERRSWAIVLLSLAALGAVAWWAHGVVRNNVRERTQDRLHLVLNAEVEGLTALLRGQQTLVAWIAAEPGIRNDLVELVVRAPRLTVPQLRRLPAALRLTVRLHPLLESHGYENFAVIGMDGRVVASNDSLSIGTISRAYTPDLIERLRRGETITVPPYGIKVRDSAGEQTGRLRPVLVTATPLFAGPAGPAASGQVIGWFDIRSDPAAVLDPIITAGRPGRTGETYIFNREGVLLTNSRFNSELRRAGLLSRDTLIGSALHVRLANPGGDLLRGFDPGTPPMAWPLTLLAQHATEGRDGLDLDGYRNYLGQDVVGTWRWFPKASVGLGVEQAVTESYEGIRILWRAFAALLGLLILGTGLIWLGFDALERARTRARRAEQLGQYTLERMIGEGAMGTVYRASHAFLRRPTAVKLLRPERNTPQALKRFEKEVQATSQLVHPNTITIFDYGRSPGGTFYYAMEYLRGLTLDVVVQRFGPLPERRVAHILRQVCGSLAEAHAAGLIHRDIKPQNLMLCHRGEVADFVKVLDFGLVKESEVPDADLTRDGAAVGTPLYMAPEAASASAEIDARADLYSLGVVAYFLVTGVQPFFGINAREVMRRHMEERPMSPSEKLGQPISPEFEALVLRLLAKDPAQRPQSARDVELMLDDVIEPMLGRWTEEEADAWWRANAPQLIGFADAAAPSGPALRLSVDVESRAERS
jgi:hypothetical protein